MKPKTAICTFDSFVVTSFDEGELTKVYEMISDHFAGKPVAGQRRDVTAEISIAISNARRAARGSQKIEGVTTLYSDGSFDWKPKP